MVAATDSCSHRRQARAQSGGGAQRNGGELGTRDDGLQEEEGLQRKQHQDECMDEDGSIDPTDLQEQEIIDDLGFSSVERILNIAILTSLFQV
ncbi:uncharacterized protein LOC8066329 isoform X2 [Sorghum bicolor]|uniref:uncharacterized protein LOC8066329 isoform X2 n=1 Tax=Sorghum bicolor TaxID=4558 RepID=UPI000B4238DB|nr:uncharacterized protein LOC8066329 isoform X2 [Sorghum bicolor]|eukprot:XP_021302133.1 uncharacterized protein LOC8066329 isoform X2 [Sorghum bicolor]